MSLSKAFKQCKVEALTTIMQRFCKEVMTWKTLDHSNVLPLLGVTMSNMRFSLISEWMDNQDINKFVKVHENVNRFELVRTSCYCQIRLSLIYLLVARRCHQRAYISAQSGSGTWGPEGGMILTLRSWPVA